MSPGRPRPTRPTADLFVTFFATFRFVSISVSQDGEGDTYTLHGTTHDGVRVQVMRDSALEMVEAALGRGRKRCLRCGQEKSIEEFARLRSSPDGHLPRCKVCERQRVRQYARKPPAAGELGSGQGANQ